MEGALSPDFTDRVMDIIYSHHRDRVNSLLSGPHARYFTPAEKRYAVTSDRRFLGPFRHTVVHGLYSGEWKQSLPIRMLKIKSCDHSIFRAYYDNPYRGTNMKYHRPPILVKKSSIKEAVRDLFKVSYGLGTEFHDIENFRNEEGFITTLSADQGSSFINVLTEGLSIDVPDTQQYSKDIWRLYSSGIAPRLFNF
jgi:hypothetical protein